MRSADNPFIISAVRVFNTFNTFNRFSTKCCTIDFVILTNFQHFNKFSTFLSTVFFATFFHAYAKKSSFSTFPLSLLLRLQQVNIINNMEPLGDKSPVPYLIGTGLGDTIRVSPSSSFASLLLFLLFCTALQSLRFRILVCFLLWLLLVCFV